MQFNVAQLLKEPTGATRQYELNESLDGLDKELKPLGPLVGVLQLLRTNSGVLASGDLSTAVRVTCNRCLEPIAQVVRFQLAEHFHPLADVYTGRLFTPAEFEGPAEELEDAALVIDERHILDLKEVLRQAIWLALPIVPGCNWTGKGECPNLIKQRAELGVLQDVEVYSDREVKPGAEDEIDPRWAALLKLRDLPAKSE